MQKISLRNSSNSFHSIITQVFTQPFPQQTGLHDRTVELCFSVNFTIETIILILVDRWTATITETWIYDTWKSNRIRR